MNGTRKRASSVMSDDDFLENNKENNMMNIKKTRSASNISKSKTIQTPLTTKLGPVKPKPHSMPPLPLQDKTNIQKTVQVAKGNDAKLIKKSKSSKTAIKYDSIDEEAEQTQFEENEVSCDRIIRELNIVDIIKSKFSSPLALFREIESSGQLSEEILKFFSKYDKISTLSLSPTYAPTKTELNFLVSKPLPIELCTTPLYKGFPNLRVLDLTNIPIQDEQLRYLITIPLEAIGLSGTEISNRGLKYLANHARFSETLTCMKLCYVQKLDDNTISILKCFKRLDELDLLGTKLTTVSIYEMFNQETKLCFTKVRLPSNLFIYLREQHVFFYGDTEISNLVASPADVHCLSKDESVDMLKRLKKRYSDVYLNLNAKEISEKLTELIERRRKEELVWKTL